MFMKKLKFCDHNFQNEMILLSSSFMIISILSLYYLSSENVTELINYHINQISHFKIYLSLPHL